ncbi:hypothetical protein [Mastigocoleus testarum]|uniref:Uncharacterized protein n=1 Tax=Mastigocoleus testarum BC008 TaxID=371196 RepID=A0A0V7ZDN7_9CYAN|nr:hypothetical protein [Mastigocoleus testarum]KST62656.1 hypothetical protein BC008_38145 [Mastigocoleus testarum BC008]
MTEPVTTLTATAIATLAFTKFIEGGAGKLAQKFTESAWEKIDKLREKIWNKLRGKKNAEAAMTAIEKGSGENISQELNRLGVYLQDVMDDDPEFKAELEAIAQEINAGKLQDNSQMVMNIDGQNNTGYQTKNEVTNQGGTNYTGNNTINNNYYQQP